jgi:hypothetical protein
VDVRPTYTFRGRKIKHFTQNTPNSDELNDLNGDLVTKSFSRSIFIAFSSLELRRSQGEYLQTIGGAII